MADIAKSLLQFVKPREVTTTTTFFRLFSSGSVALCLGGSLLCAASQYFGEPIVCHFDGQIDAGLAKQYCWTHGSYWVKREYQDDFECQ